MEASSVNRWKLNPCCRFHWLNCGEVNMVFNAASGQTHVLNELCVAALCLLEKSVLSNVELSERLVAQYDELVLDAELQDYINRMLADLDAAGLIEPYRA